MLGDLFGTRSRPGPARIEQVRAWVIEAPGLATDTPVLVTELRCTEPGCPPLETVIAILDRPGAPRQHKLYKPLTEITQADVRGLAAAPAGAADEPGHPGTKM
ncbi:MAG TPA: hypothetical protein VII06_18405 [Chloroflexota bacterium]|jgi:hypothetical protein